MSGRHRVGDPYAGIPGRRLFIAVPLPDDAVTEVRQVVESVQRAGLPAGARDVRWVRSRMDSYGSIVHARTCAHDLAVAALGEFRDASERLPFGRREPDELAAALRQDPE